MNVMKSAVTIILLICIIHSLGYIYKSVMNEQHPEKDDYDMKLEKSLDTAFDKLMSLNEK